MHEIGYCESLLPAVEARAQGRPVARVRVRAGATHRLVPESFQQAFDLVAEGTVAGGARTELVTVPVQVRCESCGARSTALDMVAVCPGCGGLDVVTTGGDDFILELVEFQAAAPAPD